MYKKKDFIKGLPTDPKDAKEARRSFAWARRNMESLGQHYPNKWVGIRGTDVVAVANSAPELDRIVDRYDSELPIVMFHVVLNPDAKTTEKIRQNPWSFGRITTLEGGSSKKFFVPPQIKINEDGSCMADEVIAHLQNPNYQSVSFDLHSTLLIPKKSLESDIYAAFRSVLIENGCEDVVEDLEKTFGDDVESHVAGVAKKYYRFHDKLLIKMPEMLQHPGPRWVMSNTYALAELVAGDIDNMALIRKTLGTAKNHVRMGTEVHNRISGSRPEQWYVTSEQKKIVDTAIERGILISIISNGTHSSVVDCTRTYFPEIPSWHIFTPAVLRDTGKPSLTHAALVLFSIGCAIVRNAIEGEKAPVEVMNALPKKAKGRLVEEWKKARAAGRDQLYKQVTDSQKEKSGEDTFSLIKNALTLFCMRFNLPKSILGSIIILPHQHLHVGNSEYHDTLPLVGLSLPFESIFYVAKDPSKK